MPSVGISRKSNYINTVQRAAKSVTSVYYASDEGQVIGVLLVSNQCISNSGHSKIRDLRSCSGGQGHCWDGGRGRRAGSGLPGWANQSRDTKVQTSVARRLLDDQGIRIGVHC